MSTVVRARIDEKIKEEAAAVLDTIGLTVSDAFRLMMIRIATEKRLPFDPLVPNEETVAAMQAAQRAELVTVGDVDGLMAHLNAAGNGGAKLVHGSGGIVSLRAEQDSAT